MKRTLISIACGVALSLFAGNAIAQDTVANSETSSVSAVQATTQSGVYSYNEATSIPKETWLNNVPSVSAPAIFGGGHPCLAGSSGSANIAGFGGGFGAAKAETICMLWFTGQPEAAIRAMAMMDPIACKAMNHVGYYRVDGKAAAFNCGDKEVVKGGIYTNATGTKTAPSVNLGFTKCARRADNSILIKYNSAGKKDKAKAQSNCSASLK